MTYKIFLFSSMLITMLHTSYSVSEQMPNKDTLISLGFDPALTCISDISLDALKRSKKTDGLDKIQTYFVALEQMPSIIHTQPNTQKNASEKTNKCLAEFEKKLDTIVKSTATPTKIDEKIKAKIVKIFQKIKDPLAALAQKNATSTDSNIEQINMPSVQKITKIFQDTIRPLTTYAKTYPSEDSFLYIRNTIRTFLRRITTDTTLYAKTIESTIERNFAPTPTIKATEVYHYLGFEWPEQCIPFKSVYTVLQDKKAHAQTEKENMELRQIGYLFSTALGKQEFDAYLAGPEHLKKLALVVPNDTTAQYITQNIIELFQDISICGAEAQ